MGLRGVHDADTDDEVAAAWHAVDLLRRVYAAPDRDTDHRRLVAFYEWAVEVNIREVTRLATTIDTWQDEVLAFFDTRATNAATESANVKIKDVRRAARGFRNDANYRARIRLHAGQPRSVPTTTRIRSYTLTHRCLTHLSSLGKHPNGPMRLFPGLATGCARIRGSVISPRPGSQVRARPPSGGHCPM